MALTVQGRAAVHPGAPQFAPEFSACVVYRPPRSINVSPAAITETAFTTPLYGAVIVPLPVVLFPVSDTKHVFVKPPEVGHAALARSDPARRIRMARMSSPY